MSGSRCLRLVAGKVLERLGNSQVSNDQAGRRLGSVESSKMHR